MLIIHDGNSIPTVQPIDPDDEDWVGFEYALDTGETITSSAWLINGTVVTAGQTIDGITFVSSQYQGSITKALFKMNGSTAVALITNRIATSAVPSRDRSCWLPVASL